MFSVSTIYSTKNFLELINQHSIAAEQFIEAFGKFHFESAPKILQLSTECGWIHLKPDGQIVLSERGAKIVPNGFKEALRMQMEDMILNYNPTWASLLPKGREETLPFLPDDVAQCFKEAGFVGELTNDLIEYWDRLALAYRNYNQKQLLETGRIGERLSIAYEVARVKRPPVWQSVESNLSGYDILSSVDEKLSENLLIEVKASTSKLDYAYFYVSRNEWCTAESAKNYCFHLWLIGKSNSLYVLEPSKIKKHIAENLGEGQWQSIKIPYSAVIESKEPTYALLKRNSNNRMI